MVTDIPEHTVSEFTIGELTALADKENWVPVTLHAQDFYSEHNDNRTENCTYRAPNGTVITLYPQYNYTDNGPVPLILVTGRQVHVTEYESYQSLTDAVSSVPGGRVVGVLTETQRKAVNHNPVTDTLTRPMFAHIVTVSDDTDSYTVTPIVKRHTLEFPLEELRTAVDTIETIHTEYTTIESEL